MPAAKKDASVRARSNRASTARALPAKPASTKARPLPPLPDGEMWHPMAQRWWDDVWASPMATEFVDVDLNGLYVLAVLENDFWSATSRTARRDAAAEIRLQRKDFGLTPYDRRRLEWTINPEPAGDAKPATSRSKGVRQPKKGEDPRRVLKIVS